MTAEAITCERCLELVPHVVDGEADAAASRAVEHHVSTCHACRCHAALDRATVAAMRRNLRVATADDAFRQRIAAALDREDHERTRGGGSSLGRGVVVTALALALVLSGAAIPTLLSSTPPHEPVPPSPAQIHGRLACLACELQATRASRGLETMLAGQRGGVAANATTASAPGSDPAPPRGAVAAAPVAHSHGRLHLEDDSGVFWELVPEGPEAALLEDHALAGRGVSLFGRVEPALHAVRVARLRLDATPGPPAVSPEAATAAASAPADAAPR